MSDNVCIINNRDYILINFSIGEREIKIEVNNIELETLLIQWFNESRDSEQGIDPNYKKNINIKSGSETYCFRGCWVRRVPDPQLSIREYIINYDHSC